MPEGPPRESGDPVGLACYPSLMPRLSARLSENARGDYFVDDACIDCETRRILAPHVFERSHGLGLAERIEAIGGVETMFLTHRDDVADHARYASRFGCARVMHSRDVGPDTGEVERRIQGDHRVPLSADLLAIPTPGHTRGSMALLVPETLLFTGDHLWGSEDGEGGSKPGGMCVGTPGPSRRARWRSCSHSTSNGYSPATAHASMRRHERCGRSCRSSSDA